MNILKRRPDYWLPAYAMNTFARARARRARSSHLTHIMFLVCDHYEPQHAAKTPAQPAERVQTWLREYARFQARCAEAFGTSPLHTWFYPPHHGEEHLKALSQMVFDGLGEVELHYHHDGDTSETLRRDLIQTIDLYRCWGLLLESGAQPQTKFGFIHGDWALGNSGGGHFCGVNDELTILEELGCWGDFTMPSANHCQTRKINSVYYAEGNAQKPKSHDWGPDAEVNVTNQRGMWLMQGPLGINWGAPKYPRIENASLTSENWGRPDRIRKWLDSNVHVKGRPDWLFIKLHTHGAIERDFDALFGEKAFAMHKMLNEQFNDGEQFRLHYVTARQAFNIAKAAEDGKTGDPSQWLDYRIAKQPHSFYMLTVRHKLVSCTKDNICVGEIDCGTGENASGATLSLAFGAVQEIEGVFSSATLDMAKRTLLLDGMRPHAVLRLKSRKNAQLQFNESNQMLERISHEGYDVHCVKANADGRLAVCYVGAELSKTA